MAANFRRIKTADLSMSSTLLYTAPANTKVIVMGFVISNKSSGQINIVVTAGDVQITGTNTPVPAGSALSILDGKIVLEPGDQVIATCNQAASADSYLSLVEMT